MASESQALIGYVIDVQGGSISVVLIDDEQEQSTTVTIGDEDILVGQIGSYVSISQGDVRVLALTIRMTEQEKVGPSIDSGNRSDSTRMPYSERILRLTPVGTINATGEFERGISRYPTTGAEVYAVGSSDVDVMFSKFRSKGYEVGKLSSNSSLGVFLDPTSLFGRHFAILGQTGSGKSWTVATLLQKAVAIMPRAHIIVLDLHGEYFWKDDDENLCSAFSPDIARYVDARELEMPYWLMTYGELCDLLIDRTEHSAHNQLAVFRDAVSALKLEEGKRLSLERTTLDTPIYFDLLKLREVVESRNGQIKGAKNNMINGPLTGAFDNFLMRLDSRLGDVRYDFLLKPVIRDKSESLEPLLRDFVGLGDPKRPITVMGLSSVPFDVRPTVAAQIGRLAFEFNYWNPEYRDFPLLLICEEAHAYIPRASETQYSGARRSMERIAKEGRKYGVGLGVVSQRPHEVSETVLSQCGSFICLRITNPADQNYVRNLVPESERDLVDILAGLGRGETMALGEAVPLPTRFKFFVPEPTPNSDDIDFYTKWKDGPEDLNVETIVDRWRRQER